MYDALVLGAGVIGLSIARELHQRGLKVAIVARDLPDEAHSTGFSSPWAGCNWFSFEKTADTPHAEWDRITFRKLGKLAADFPDLCARIPFYSVWSRPKPDGGRPWFHELVGEYRDLDDPSGKSLPGGFPFGHTFTSYILHAPGYTAHLGRQVRALGIPIIRQRLMSIDEAFDLPQIGPVKLVVNALGLGARALAGVEDEKMYPARGQTVLVYAPGVKTCVMHTEGFMAPPPKAGEKPLPPPAYIIPRPGPEDHVVLGGTYIKDDYSTLPDLRESERILKACYALEPRLAGPNGKSWRDIKVVSHNVGLRPAREGGARLELEERHARKGDKAVVHAYGFGSAGFQCSLGVAEKAAELVSSYLETRPLEAKL
ncbi:hypothetical protein BCR39DRAFT_543895 [Naematelia encephala]|uniref:FAD dependent oxidoreductase domain-containing protein n=1 Tax=Naematelia encephala TaxID=71784 RepID=A0A1Y2ASK3_9TREE|nr:hypothetical protein BCR39DRAFT_543895 [Naematelia encephala]